MNNKETSNTQNDSMHNKYTNTRIEYHILQSFPVTCLNRDDSGAPKSAMVGGTVRARVSSQCWKRQVRLAMQELGIKLGIRTKKIEDLFVQVSKKQDVSEERARACGNEIAKFFNGDTLLFISEGEMEAFVTYAAEREFDVGKLQVKELSKVAKQALNPRLDALDIALFGRMVANAAEMNVEAAASFAHAISTHEVTNELEFFTALDDLQEEPGSAHMGNLEYNSATYYRYVSLDLGQLAQTLGEEDLKKAIEVFTKALFVAVPGARQSTQSGYSPWEFARVIVGKGQRLQVPFERAVAAKGHGYVQPSIQELKKYLDDKKSLFGSMHGHQEAYDWGENTEFSIDLLISALQTHIR